LFDQPINRQNVTTFVSIRTTILVCRRAYLIQTMCTDASEDATFSVESRSQQPRIVRGNRDDGSFAHDEP
jgi:hypothetical protein